MVNLSFKLNTLWLVTVTIGIFGYDLSPAWGNDSIAYQDYQYACGHLNPADNLFNHNCDRRLIPFDSDPPAGSQFIFQSKSDEIPQKFSPHAEQHSDRLQLQYRESRSNNTGIADYLVSTVFGVYFPTLETLEANSGGSFFGGIKILPNLRLDAEIVGIFDGNTVEKAYFDLSAFLSLRFSLPLSQAGDAPLFYLSPGIGIAEIDDNNSDDEDTNLSWQLEGGIAAPIHRGWGGYGGLKYVDGLSENGREIFAAECGLTWEL